jgi:hypothetical protein
VVRRKRAFCVEARDFFNDFLLMKLAIGIGWVGAQQEFQLDCKAREARGHNSGMSNS